MLRQDWNGWELPAQYMNHHESIVSTIRVRDLWPEGAGKSEVL